MNYESPAVRETRILIAAREIANILREYKEKLLNQTDPRYRERISRLVKVSPKSK